jgi:predicted transcriptional regulator
MSNYLPVHKDVTNFLVPLMTNEEIRLYIFILNHTRGLNRKTARLSLSFIQNGNDVGHDLTAVKYSGVNLSRATIAKAINSLVEYGFIKKYDVNREGTLYGIGDNIRVDELNARSRIKSRKNKQKMARIVKKGKR